MKLPFRKKRYISELVILNMQGNEPLIRDKDLERNQFLRRTLIAFIFMIFLLIILLINLFKLQFIHYKFYATESNKNRIEMITIPPHRGIIYDRNRTPLAKNVSIYQLNIIPDKEMIPFHFKNLDDELTELKKIISLSDEEIRTFTELRKNYAMHRDVPLKSSLTRDEIFKLSARQHLFSNVSINTDQHRHYPYGAALSHLLGYMSRINDNDRTKLIKEKKFDNYAQSNDIGKSGIERYYEDVLHGTVGYRQVEIDSRRRIVHEIEQEVPKNGEDIYLTIDLKLQLYIYDLLKDKRAAVVAIDPNNGEVLALVSTPSFDPNLFVGGISNSDYSRFRDDPNKPLYNRATLGQYSPASTVKPFMLVTALLNKVITPKTVMSGPGYWQLPNSKRKFRDWKRSGHGAVNIIKSIEESVDTFYYQVAFDLGIDKINYWMSKFSYGTRTGIDLSDSEVNQGILPSREWKWTRFKQPWLPGDTVSIGIGQGYWTSTALQQAKALTILINEGKTYRPHILFKTSGDLNKLNFQNYEESNPELEKIDPKYWNYAKYGMYQVLYGPTGTGRHIFAGTPYKAAGKSGTAQVYSLKENEEYDSSKIPEYLRDNALFISFAPYDKPKIALALILENAGSGSSQGGAIARKILDFYLLGKDDRKKENKQTVSEVNH